MAQDVAVNRGETRGPPRRPGAAGTQAGHLRVPARAGVLRGAVIVPILLGSAIGLTPEQLGYLINADLFTCGIASIIQTIGFWKIGVRLPLLQGVTFAAVSPMISIGLAEGGGVPGLRAIFGAVIIAGIVTFVVAPFFANLIRLFPPVVTGTVITIIGVVLLSVAALDAGGGGASQFTEPDIRCAAQPRAGRLHAGLHPRALQVLQGVCGNDRRPDRARRRHGRRGDIRRSRTSAGLRTRTWFGVTTPFHFGAPTFNAAAIIAMVIVMLITMVETTGDVFACADIVEKPVDKTDVARALRADGLATTLGGILNSFPYTCFAENVGLVRLTKVKSRYVVATAGLIMMIIGIFPKVGAAVAAIPPPVLGGAAFALFGTVAVVGIQILRRVDFHDERNVIILAISLAMAITPTVYPTIFNGVPQGVRTIISSGITMGSITAILLNLIFNVWGGKSNLVTKVLPTPQRDDVYSIDQVNQMDREQFVAEFGGLFQGPPWIAEQAYDARPFEDVYALRRAFHDALFDAPPDRQLELIQSYPDIGSVFRTDATASVLSVKDQAFAGLDRLDSDEHHNLERPHLRVQEEVRLPADHRRTREHQGDDPAFGQRPA